MKETGTLREAEPPRRLPGRRGIGLAVGVAMLLSLSIWVAPHYLAGGDHHNSPAGNGYGDYSYLKTDAAGNRDSLLVTCDRTHFNAHAAGRWWTNGDRGFKRDPDGAYGKCGKLNIVGNGTRHDVCSGKREDVSGFDGFWGCGGDSLHDG